jgi:methyl-accepting chemotaxis protein
MVNEISSASQEQAHGVHEITKAISQLDQVTQQNTSNSADSANAAGSLSGQASILNSLVQKLVQTIEGGSGETAVKVRNTPGPKIYPSSPSAPSKGKTQPAPKVAKAQNQVKLAPKKEIKTESLSASAIPSSNDNRFEDV